MRAFAKLPKVASSIITFEVKSPSGFETLVRSEAVSRRITEGNCSGSGPLFG
jgi:hypothetical protein